MYYCGKKIKNKISENRVRRTQEEQSILEKEWIYFLELIVSFWILIFTNRLILLQTSNSPNIKENVQKNR